MHLTVCMFIFSCYLFPSFCSISVILSKPNSDEALALIPEASAVQYLKTVSGRAKYSSPLKKRKGSIRNYLAKDSIGIELNGDFFFSSPQNVLGEDL